MTPTPSTWHYASNAACTSPAGLAATLTRSETSALLRYRVPEHVAHLAGLITRAVSGTIPRRLMIFAPPRHGKSELVSHWTPVWFLNRFPERRVMFATYSREFANDWGRKVRNTAMQYADALSFRVAADSKSTGRWHTDAGGGMVAQGVGGAFTGRGAELAICDDPFKNSDDANSAVRRAKVWDWWASTFLTRLEPDATVILTMTRWHVDDLAGRILGDAGQRSQWHVVSLPALAEDNDALGRSAGQPLWPGRISVAELAHRRIGVGEYVWDSLYQQRPPDLNGGSVYHQFRYASWPQGNIDSTVKIVPGVPLCLTIDFNKRPGSHALIGQFFDQTSEVFAIEELFTPLGVATHIAERFAQWWRERKPDVPEILIFGDASGGSGSLTDGRSAWSAVRAVLGAAEIPFSFKVPRKNPGVHDRVETMNSALCDVNGQRSLRIHPGCTRLINDLQKVVWDRDEINKRSDPTLTHMSDAAGYFVRWKLPLRSARSSEDTEQYTSI